MYPISVSFGMHTINNNHLFIIMVLTMTMSRKDVGLKHVNWPNLEVLTLHVWKCETRGENDVQLWFSDDIVIKLATALTM